MNPRDPSGEQAMQLPTPVAGETSLSGSRADVPYRVVVAITPRTIWLATALVAAVAALIFVLSRALGVVILLFVAIILAEGIRPLVVWIVKQTKVPRAVAVLLIYLAILATLGFLGWLLISPLVEQFIA